MNAPDAAHEALILVLGGTGKTGKIGEIGGPGVSPPNKLSSPQASGSAAEVFR